MPTWVDKILNSQSVQLALAALAFLIALWLVIVIARMLMGGRLRLPGGRTRQARLGIVDAFDLDRQRQLIIVRRDNTEHLVMIGGPNDLLIESEIVRVEARDLRDIRRDKGSDLATDGRIPAPIVAPGPDAGLIASVDEPLLPMTLPQTVPPEGMAVQAAEIAPTALPVEPLPQSRAPTFPLPPRRPVSSPTADKRLPPLPERAMRAEEPAAAPFPSGAPPAAPPVQSPTPPASPIPAPTVEAPRPAPTRPAPPPFLKPLPPRPPVRPLRRTTPQAEQTPARPAGTDAPSPSAPSSTPAPGSAAAGVGGPGGSAPNPNVSAPAPAAGQAAAPLAPAARPTPVPPPSGATPTPTSPGEKDALESLEEEMAKLLGRGSNG